MKFNKKSNIFASLLYSFVRDILLAFQSILFFRNYINIDYFTHSSIFFFFFIFIKHFLHYPRIENMKCYSSMISSEVLKCRRLSNQFNLQCRHHDMRINQVFLNVIALPDRIFLLSFFTFFFPYILT